MYNKMPIKSRKSRKYNATKHLMNAIKSKDKKDLMIALDNFDYSKGWNGNDYVLYKKGSKIFYLLNKSHKRRKSRKSRKY